MKMGKLNRDSVQNEKRGEKQKKWKLLDLKMLSNQHKTANNENLKKIIFDPLKFQLSVVCQQKQVSV